MKEADKRTEKTNKFHVFRGNFSYLIKRLLLERGNWEEIKEQKRGVRRSQFIWKPTRLAREDYSMVYDRVLYKKETCITNHIKGNQVICTKTGIMRSLENYYKHNEVLYLNNLSFNDVMPTCFLLTSGVEDNEYYKFTKRYDELAKDVYRKERMPKKHCADNWWLIKPANLNQGRGIKISNNKSEILQIIKQQIPHSLWVVQKYLEKPLLYKGRKFDIRLWALVTKDMEVYIYKKSYVRTSSSEFTLDSTKDKVTHLTNNCFQVKCDTYGKHEEGNIISLSDLEKYIRETKYADYTMNAHFFPYAKNHVLDTILSGFKYFYQLKDGFELFGFDLMIDQDLRVWLIECNTNPHLGMPNEMMRDQVPTMINEMLSLVVDPIFPPKKRPDYEMGNYWKVFEDKRDRLRDYEMLNRGLYPAPDIVDEEVLGLTRKAYQKDIKLRGGRSRYKRKTGHEVSRGYNRRRGRRGKSRKLSASQDNIKKLQSRKRVHSATDMDDSEDSSASRTRVNRSPNQSSLSNSYYFSQTRKSRFDKLKDLASKKKNKRHYRVQNIENVKNLITKTLNGKYLDEDELSKLISRSVSCVVNFELHSDEQLELAFEGLMQVVKSQFDYLLGKGRILSSLVSTLMNEELSEVFFEKLVALIEKLVSNYKLRWEFLPFLDDLIDTLGKYLSPLILENTEISTKDVKLISSVCRILYCLIGNYDRKFYVPGETILNDKTRFVSIFRGALVILISLIQKSKSGMGEGSNGSNNDYKFLKKIEDGLDKYLASEDWMIQKIILQELKTHMLREVDDQAVIEAIRRMVPEIVRLSIAKVAPELKHFEDKKQFRMAEIRELKKNQIQEVDEEEEAGLKDSAEDSTSVFGPTYLKLLSNLGIDDFLDYVSQKLAILKIKEAKKKKADDDKDRNQVRVSAGYKRRRAEKDSGTLEHVDTDKEERKKRLIEKLKIQEQENHRKRRERYEKDRKRKENIKSLMNDKRQQQSAIHQKVGSSGNMRDLLATQTTTQLSLKEKKSHRLKKMDHIQFNSLKGQNMPPSSVKARSAYKGYKLGNGSRTSGKSRGATPKTLFRMTNKRKGDVGGSRVGSSQKYQTGTSNSNIASLKSTGNSTAFYKKMGGVLPFSNTGAGKDTQDLELRHHKSSASAQMDYKSIRKIRSGIRAKKIKGLSKTISEQDQGIKPGMRYEKVDTQPQAAQDFKLRESDVVIEAISLKKPYSQQGVRQMAPRIGKEGIDVDEGIDLSQTTPPLKLAKAAKGSNLGGVREANFFQNGVLKQSNLPYGKARRILHRSAMKRTVNKVGTGRRTKGKTEFSKTMKSDYASEQSSVFEFGQKAKPELRRAKNHQNHNKQHKSQLKHHHHQLHQGRMNLRSRNFLISQKSSKQKNHHEGAYNGNIGLDQAFSKPKQSSMTPRTRPLSYNSKLRSRGRGTFSINSRKNKRRERSSGLAGGSKNQSMNLVSSSSPKKAEEAPDPKNLFKIQISGLTGRKTFKKLFISKKRWKMRSKVEQGVREPEMRSSFKVKKNQHQSLSKKEKAPRLGFRLDKELQLATGMNLVF